MRDLLPRVTLNVVPQMAKTAASMTVQLVDGTRLAAETPLALGNPGNSMQWADMEQKFLGVVESVAAWVVSMKMLLVRGCRSDRS